ncbi:MAG: methionyl-tRNA formyltransferase [Defluviitaleaceae bacterium]|nr:methionyl-tRNA formyltransferase [Defluviitaleaceae bacterium]
MKIIFMGTPQFAVPSLKAVIAQHEVVAVCTQPDRPAGRGHKLAASPVKEVAVAHGLPVFQPQTLKLSESKEIRDELASFGADIFVVAAYGLLLPKGVLTMPPHGCINVHASLLPAYRGASPMQAALLNGDTETGITIQQMDTGIDTGDIILQKKLIINLEDRLPQLHDKMAELGAVALLEALAAIENGTASHTPQDEAFATHCPKFNKTDGLINWNDTSKSIINKTRALDPWPGCYTMYNGEVLKIWRVDGLSCDDNAAPGTVLNKHTKGGVVVKTGDGAVFVTELQAVGKKRMDATAFLRGFKINAGDVFG